MTEELTSEGKCLYCEQMLSQKEMVKHIAKHLADKEKAYSGLKTQTYCHIMVEADIMFLNLLVNGSAKIKTIDNYLRDIWLECCGHLSGFTMGREEIGMNNKVKDVFKPKVKITYDYDFGTTTRLYLKGLKSYELNETKNILLLSRNEPLKIMCSTCKNAPADSMCTVCCWEKEAYYCMKCTKKHEKECEDFADYSQMPIVNSPRMGECGYTGGSIDLARDGVYKMKSLS